MSAVQREWRRFGSRVFWVRSTQATCASAAGAGPAAPKSEDFSMDTDADDPSHSEVSQGQQGRLKVTVEGIRSCSKITRTKLRWGKQLFFLVTFGENSCVKDNGTLFLLSWNTVQLSTFLWFSSWKPKNEGWDLNPTFSVSFVWAPQSGVTGLIPPPLSISLSPVWSAPGHTGHPWPRAVSQVLWAGATRTAGAAATSSTSHLTCGSGGPIS